MNLNNSPLCSALSYSTVDATHLDCGNEPCTVVWPVIMNLVQWCASVPPVIMN